MPKSCNYDGCNRPQFGGGYCPFHQYLRTDKKKKERVAPKPIAKVSKKQAISNKQYSQLREDFLKSNPLCIAKLPDCTRIATDVHHKKGRVGKFFLDTSTWCGLCRSCHQKVELDPKMAKELGLSDSRLD
jgi:hypothetical protein